MSPVATIGRMVSGRRAAGASRRKKTRRPATGQSPTFLALLGVIVLLCLVGLVMVLSASSVAAHDELGDSYYFFRRQAIWLLVGLAVLIVTARIDYRVWRRFAGPLLIVSAILLFIVLIPQIGVSVNGSRRWLGGGPLRLQPSELAKLALLLYGADLLARRGAWMSDARVTVRPLMIVASVFAGLVVVEPDLGTAIVIVALTLGLLWTAGAPALSLGLYVSFFALAGGALALYEPYRRARLTAFLDPWSDVQNTGWQTIQSQVGIASGGLFGVGLGNGDAKRGFLPFAHTDFIYAVIAEETGLFGALVVLSLFGALFLLGIRTATHAPDRFGALLAGGVTVWITAQALVNVGAVVGALPITGVPLPLLSSGGSSLVVTMAALGMLLSVASRVR